ncbi:MAG: hypothetical protein R2746_14430 [Acidimicrobiales bacterium]
MLADPAHRPSPNASRPRPGGIARDRVGLVLGAGGIVGQAFHAGVLGALANDLGWDPAPPR